MYEMGGVSSMNALPGDPAFNQQDNPYSKPAYEKLCGELSVDPSTDFRYTKGKNHGLGTVYYKYKGDAVPSPTDFKYPDPQVAVFKDDKKGDDSDYWPEQNISFIRNDAGADKQFEHFDPNYTSGFTLAGLGRLNKSVKASGYAILGAQENVRGSIVGRTGSAFNAQKNFLKLIEDAVVTTDATKRTTDYQDAITATKVRLNFAVGKGVLLLPARMIINTESVVGYNNNLVAAGDDTKVGINNGIDQGTKKAAVKKMAGDSAGDKTNPPNSEASNKTHQEAIQAQGIAGGTQAQATSQTTAQATGATQAEATIEPHHVNKAIVGVGALALVGVLVWLR